MKQLLFSITKKDFRVDTFRAGGKGGQKQNKTESGVRIVHIASGAVGEARDQRSQEQNKRNAFRRLLETDKWKTWYRLEVANAYGLQEELEAKVENLMKPSNIRIEVKKDGKWTEVTEDML